MKKFKSQLVLAPPANIVSPAKHPLPGEGVWHVAGRTTANGIPTVYEAFVRPDAVHTSYVVGVAWMDTNLLTAQLYSGSVIPGGGPFTYTAPVSAKDTEDLVAAFNAGFLTSDSNGGYYTQGKTIIPLRKGAASVVIFKNGRMTVAKWGRDVVMTNQIASVRQNLDLIVDNAKPVPGLDNPNSIKWGRVLGNSYNVWRSGLGITKSGALVYVGGPSMSIADLADILIRAGGDRRDGARHQRRLGPVLDLHRGAQHADQRGQRHESLVVDARDARAATSSRTGAATSSPCRCAPTRRTRRHDDHATTSTAVSGPSPFATAPWAGVENQEDVAKDRGAPDDGVAVGEPLQDVVGDLVDVSGEGDVRQSLAILVRTTPGRRNCSRTPVPSSESAMP